MITPYFMMGEVLRPHGIHGEAKVRPYARDPEDFRRWETLYLKRGESWQPIASRYVRFMTGTSICCSAPAASPRTWRSCAGRRSGSSARR